MSGASQQPPKGGTRCDAGFSLLELMVVLTILAGVASLALSRFGPGLGRTPPQTTVQSMAVQLAADLRATRAEALRTNAEQTFTLELGQRATWSLARPSPRRFVDGIDIEVTGPSLEWSGDRAVQFRFQPTGAATGGEIIISESRQAAPPHAARISIDWLTGVARIERAR